MYGSNRSSAERASPVEIARDVTLASITSQRSALGSCVSGGGYLEDRRVHR